MHSSLKNKYDALIARVNSTFKKLGMVTSSGRRCSKSTHEGRYQAIVSSFIVLYENGYAIKKPACLKVKHFHCLFDEWLNNDISPGRIQNLYSYWRFFLKGVDKTDLIKQAEHHYDRIDELTARKKRLRKGEHPDRSWIGNNVDFIEVFKKICEFDPCVAVQLLAQGIYGLRVKESWMFKPYLSDNGDTISVLAGAKGGRLRSGVKPITLDEQGKKAMAFFKNFVGNNPLNSLTPPQYTIERWENHYYYILKKAGVTKKVRGVTSHGLRHDYAQSLFETMMDEVTAIAKHSGRTMTPKERKDHVSQIITECLGHARTGIKGVYGV